MHIQLTKDLLLFAPKNADISKLTAADSIRTNVHGILRSWAKTAKFEQYVV
jgi:hypothetical protein